jgi:hypothetical protein
MLRLDAAAAKYTPTALPIGFICDFENRNSPIRPPLVVADNKRDFTSLRCRSMPMDDEVLLNIHRDQDLANRV